ncbi:mammalian cell entry protein [Mycobacterium botniense]|uniref:Mce associated membrane protein n=1 Tax=Mycobacterium botniense TaxID=84962 RepID=A0A7I9XZ17_9MYCO|nr:mammalian cell entry protein [Mycobacterium botniense]GFG74967.1 Mce associated membrane protein [Mycobacterium botniense]
MADDAATPRPQDTVSAAGASPQRDVDEPAGDGAEGQQAGAAGHSPPPAPARRLIPVDRWALAAGLVFVAALAGLAGWLGCRAYEGHTAAANRDLFVQAARQCAVNLSTVDYEHADADVQRILGLATGTFYENFSRRSQAFIDNLRQSRSKLVGTVAEAGLESEAGDEGHVLVAVTVQPVDAKTGQEQPQAWRMRITVKKVGGAAKVSHVAFVS